MKIDREFQRQLLQQLADAYPHPADFHAESIYGDEPSAENEKERTVVANLRYLEGHGLVENETREMGDGTIYVQWSTLTSKGIDFLAQDGGLGAVLNVQVVRLHSDTVRDLLTMRIATSDLSEHEKSLLKKAVDVASEEALRTTTQKMIEMALASVPDVLQLVRTLLVV